MAQEEWCAESLRRWPGLAQTSKNMLQDQRPHGADVLRAPVTHQLEMMPPSPFCIWTLLAPESFPRLEICSLTPFGLKHCWTPGCALPSFALSLSKTVFGRTLGHPVQQGMAFPCSCWTCAHGGSPGLDGGEQWVTLGAISIVPLTRCDLRRKTDDSRRRLYDVPKPEVGEISLL